MDCFSLCLQKEDPWRYLGHRDWVRVLVRSLIRAGLPLTLTQGFRPHPKLILPEPLPLGVASEGEVFLVNLSEPWGLERVREALAPCLPEGMGISWLREGNHREPVDQPLTLAIAGAEASVLEARLPSVIEAEGLASAEVGWVGAVAHLLLVPPPGRRVSVGRVLRALADEMPEGALLDARRILGRPPDPGERDPA